MHAVCSAVCRLRRGGGEPLLHAASRRFGPADAGIMGECLCTAKFAGLGQIWRNIDKVLSILRKKEGTAWHDGKRSAPHKLEEFARFLDIIHNILNVFYAEVYLANLFFLCIKCFRLTRRRTADIM